MKTVVLLGSRNPRGQTASAAEALMEGLAGAGGRCERVYLPRMGLERCGQCEDSGWGTCLSEGRCAREDDFAPLAEQVFQADLAAFVTPVYFGDLSESMRAFLDRLRRLSRHESVKALLKGKAAVGVCVAGGGGGGAPPCAANLDGILRNCGFDVIDVIPARRQNLQLKRAVLKATGAWLAEHVPGHA